MLAQIISTKKASFNLNDLHFLFNIDGKIHYMKNLNTDTFIWAIIVLGVDRSSLLFVALSLSIILFSKSESIIFYLKYQQALQLKQYNKFWFNSR